MSSSAIPRVAPGFALDPEAAALHVRVVRLVAKKRLSYREALRLALAEWQESPPDDDETGPRRIEMAADPGLARVHLARAEAAGDAAAGGEDIRVAARFAVDEDAAALFAQIQKIRRELATATGKPVTFESAFRTWMAEVRQ